MASSFTTAQRNTALDARAAHHRQRQACAPHPLGDRAPPRRRGGSWSAVVEIPLPGGGTLSQIVRPSDVNATKAGRATMCSEDLYDKAAALAGFATV